MRALRDSQKWAQETFGAADLGHGARTKRLLKVSAALARRVGASPARASGKSSAAIEGTYRLIRNERISPAAIGESAVAATSRAAAGIATMLCIEDTTSLSYSHEVAPELGDLGGPNGPSSRGFFVHSALLVDATTGETVGLISQSYWKRETEARGQRHKRKERPYEDKESFKWEESSERVRARLGQNVMSRVVSVCDREGDVYPYLAYKIGNADRFVIRSSLDRRVIREAEQPNASRLRDAVGQAPVRGKLTVDLEQRGSWDKRPGRSARQTELTIRAAHVRLRRPETAPTSSPARLAVNVVMAREDNPPPGVEPLEWILLTSEPIDSPSQIELVLSYYRLRWRIEDFHKAWKSGAGVERRRLQSGNNILRLAVILAFVAVRLLQLREQMQMHPKASCDDALTTEEWRVLWVAVEERRPPKKVPSMQWAYRALGRLAGWSDSKRTGQVGWDTMWEGWFELQRQMEGYRAALFLVGGTRN